MCCKHGQVQTDPVQGLNRKSLYEKANSPVLCPATTFFSSSLNSSKDNILRTWIWVFWVTYRWLVSDNHEV